MSLGDGELGHASLADGSEETQKKCSNSKVVPGELEEWLLGAGAGASVLGSLLPVPPKSVDWSPQNVDW